ncbi:hypothetical protein BT96DRAFT_918674 [Gymnopus androsaceus JB14]|uniref:BTB domain-containing protein n=1 Tax=Gymnopus androsaceus JB14 TaxID=1447944 RepID=A0A6A4HWU0_9AGAR|nr:hypothetical protein BT96DRAFT_918674 [Gymnopus androsaceus JB14]
MFYTKNFDDNMEIIPYMPVMSFISICPSFNAEDANVYIRSSDNVLFGLHAANIEVVTGGFPFDSSYSTVPGVPDVPEPAALLEKLFAYFYPDFPDIEFADFPTFQDLLNFAESAARYHIRPARGISKEFLRRYLLSYPREILAFAAKHSYHSLVREIAGTELMNTSLAEIKELLRNDYFYGVWSEHKDRRTSAVMQAQACSLHVHSGMSCTTWSSLKSDILLQLNRPSVLESHWDISQLFAPHKASAKHDCCFSALAEWEEVVADIATNLPTFAL